MPIFNIRVYGMLLTEEKQVLVMDELIRGTVYTKFPGGGLEYGEGTRECLVREFMEELNLEIEVGEHIYTTDFFQQSAFHPDHQILSIYYRVHPKEALRQDELMNFIQANLAEDAPNISDEIRGIRFIDWHRFSEEDVSLPIDKIAVRVLKNSL